MTIKEVKKYLMQAHKIDKRININLRKIEAMKKTLGDVSAPPMDKIPSGIHSNSSSVENAIENVANYEERTNALIDLLVQKKIEIENSINKLQDENERAVLEYRYLLKDEATGKMIPWESYVDKVSCKYVKGISEYMNYSPRRVYQLHGSALLHLAKILNSKDCS